VIPLRPKAKVPQLNAWSQYATTMPTQIEQGRWLEGYSDGNIGLPLGPQSGIVALDIDSIDPKVMEIVERIAPASPWKRVGKKGCVFAFKYNGERTFRIKDQDNQTVLELLSRGAQVVLPPSIHPDTGRPYEANCELLSVVDVLPGLPSDFEPLLRQALIDAGFELSARGATKVAEWVPAGGRDSAMVAHAGILARAVIRGERSLLEALHEIEVWVNTYTEKVVGDPLDPDKAKQKLLEFIRRDIVEGGKRLSHGWSEGMTPEELETQRVYFGQDIEEWSIDRYVEQVKAVFTEIPPEELGGRHKAVDDILLRMAKSQHLSELDKSSMLKHIHLASGRLIQVASMKTRIKELSGGDVLGENHTEIAEALLREVEREGEVRFHNGNFYRWMGACWEVLEEHIILRTLAREFGALQAAKKFNDHRGIVNVLQKLATKPLRDDLTPGVNFANGYLTSDMRLLNHDSRFGCTYVLPYRYLNESRLPLRFLQLLDQCWGHEVDFEDRVQALREAIACTLFGQATKFSRAFCLYGMAHTGKSTVLDIVKGMVPKDSKASVPPGDWGDRFLPATLAEKLLNVGGDLNETAMIPGGTFKMIVSGEEMSAQFKGQQIFVFSPTCAHWFASNHLPRTRDSSKGFTRRWLFFGFNKVIPQSMKNSNFAEEVIAEEREDIAAWALPAFETLLQRQDYVLPACHLYYENEVATSNNTVRAFMCSNRITLGSGSMREEDAYTHYYMFCRNDARSLPYNAKRFRMLMQEMSEEMGFEVEILGNEAIYHGLTKPEIRMKRAA
jgi:putative DNA primase/helicase